MSFRSILPFIVLALLAFIGVYYWETIKPGPHAVMPSSGTDPITPFQHQMLAKGYVRNHDDHNWYPLWESIDNNGCTTYGGALDVTFKCRTPLTGGVPENK
jgi:hypothetical protein